MTQEQYVSYEVAKLLHEKGFEINTDLDYWKVGSDGHMYFMCSIGAYSSDKYNQFAFYIPADSYPCPTQQMVLRWLREEYNIHIIVEPHCHDDEKVLEYEFSYWFKNELHIPYCESHPEYHPLYGKTWKTYEECTEAAIKYCLEYLI